MADVPKIVIRRLVHRKAGAATLEPHPEANLLAAFAEQTLDSNERLQVLDHLAQCFECREVVALAVPELGAANGVFQPASVPWLSWPVLRWGAAIACVVVVGAAVTLRQREAHQARSGEGKPAVVSVPAVSSAQPVAVQSAGSGMATGPASVAKVRADQVQLSAGAQMAEPREKKATPADMMAGAANDSLVPGRAKEDLAIPSLGGNLGMPDEVVLPNSARPATANQLKASPMRVPRWTLTSDGTLERSLDLGRSWEPVSVSLEASLRALAANGFDIWVGGSAGALYHSQDAGEHWMKVQPVENGQPLTADIIGVEFPDPQHGRLTTAGGEVWTTEDAGLTWQKQ